MLWRVVRQPDGQLARYSDVVKDFTHINTDAEDIIGFNKLLYGLPEEIVKERIEEIGENFDRKIWDEIIDKIQEAHGVERVVKLLFQIASEQTSYKYENENEDDDDWTKPTEVTES